MTNELKPCPHCGLAHTLKLTTVQELAEEGEDDPEPWMHSDSWVVMCDANRPSGPGGCGASGGFYPSEAEAVEAWNRRAAIDAQQAAMVGAPKSALDHMHARCAADVQRAFGDYAATPPAAQAQDAARYQRLRLMARYDDATQTVTFPGLRLGAGSGLPDMLDAGIDGAAAQGGEHVE